MVCQAMGIGAKDIFGSQPPASQLSGMDLLGMLGIPTDKESLSLTLGLAVVGGPLGKPLGMAAEWLAGKLFGPKVGTLAKELIFGVDEGAESFPKPKAPSTWLYPDFNPSGSNTNCIACSNAFAEWWHTGKVPKNPSGDLGSGYSKAPGGLQGVKAELEKMGPGSQAQLHGVDPKAPYGHAFNAINENGTVRFVDPQRKIFIDPDSMNYPQYRWRIPYPNQ
jgi:hypothetical protein